MSLYYKNSNFEIYNQNTFDVLDNFIKEKKKFNCIFADPPYFLSNDGITCVNGKMVKVNKGDWDKSKGIEKNFQFNYDWLSRCKELLTDNGTIWISGTFHIIYAVGFAAQKLEMKFLNNIVWEKPNPPPNLSCRYFTHSTETILWFGKHKKSKHLFNYKTMKKINSGKQMKDVWRFTAPKKEEKTRTIIRKNQVSCLFSLLITFLEALFGKIFLTFLAGFFLIIEYKICVYF